MNAYHDILMPRLSDSMEEGTVLTWLKQVGDAVALGEDLVEIETDKANMVFAAEAAGTLLEIVAADGESRAVGETIARIGEPGAAPDRVPAPPAAGADAPRPSKARVKVSPIARRIAGEHGIDLSAVAGTGPGGRITKTDVEALIGASPSPPTDSEAAPAEGSAKGAVEVVALDRLQQTVARRMAESKATVPHFYLESEVDMTRAVEARGRLRQGAAEGEAVPSVNDLVVKACAIALPEFPRANGAYRDGAWELYSRINVGVAVAAPGALLVPTVFDADRKSLGEISTETRRLAERVREGQITPPELAGGTFTVSNLGMYGIESFAPVVNLPQAAILAVGSIRSGLAKRGQELVETQRMSLTLACDHRILYGADGAQLLARIRALLEEPLGLAC